MRRRNFNEPTTTPNGVSVVSRVVFICQAAGQVPVVGAGENGGAADEFDAPVAQGFSGGNAEVVAGRSGGGRVLERRDLPGANARPGRGVAVAAGLQDGGGAVAAKQVGLKANDGGGNRFKVQHGRVRRRGDPQQCRDQIPAPLSMARRASSWAMASASSQAVNAFTCGRRPFALGWTR